MSSDFDDRMDAARPSDRSADTALDDTLHRMILASEKAVQPRAEPRSKVRRKVIAGAVAGAFLLGGASAAAATQPWVWNEGLAHADTATTITMPSGDVCEIRTEIMPGSPNLVGVGRAVKVARAYSKTIDLRTFDLEKLREAALKRGAIIPSQSVDDQYSWAVTDAMSAQIFSYLRDQGFNQDNGDVGVNDQHRCTRPE